MTTPEASTSTSEAPMEDVEVDIYIYGRTYGEWSIDQLKKELTRLGVPYQIRDRKKNLFQLLLNTDGVTSAAPPDMEQEPTVDEHGKPIKKKRGRNPRDEVEKYALRLLIEEYFDEKECRECSLVYGVTGRRGALASDKPGAKYRHIDRFHQPALAEMVRSVEVELAKEKAKLAEEKKKVLPINKGNARLPHRFKIRLPDHTDLDVTIEPTTNRKMLVPRRPLLLPNEEAPRRVQRESELNNTFSWILPSSGQHVDVEEYLHLYLHCYLCTCFPNLLT
ncbi:hypothetical protein BV898_04040 [Hypsibius exemplaris]|uniref:Uncharacterized protein n=1 Tax=Hypsibius exemplaris TaxID=2072580 RepID=A0A1W0X449_HYPEX|nr:hypothetical protein BV898_04040 [Hypsibius exemplaris]